MYSYADYESIKKPILLFRILSSWFLNTFTELASTASCGRLLKLMTDSNRKEESPCMLRTVWLDQFPRMATCWNVLRS